jgi:hypothetical protein
MSCPPTRRANIFHYMKKLRIASCKDLKDLVKEIGFIPLFQNEIPGFSVMDITGWRYWWTGNEERDPWMWRMLLSKDPGIAYGKLFGGRAGFVSRKWLPLFASYRRDGYDFDARYEDGRASHKCRKIMKLFGKQASIPSFLIKSMAGFSKGGEKGFEGALTLLQMQTYLTVRSFTRKQSKSGDYYGWHVAVYSTSEDKFGYDRMTSAYGLGAARAREKVVKQLIKINPGVEHADAEKFLK